MPDQSTALATAVSHVGVDVGGTKTHVAVVGTDGSRQDAVLPSAGWRRGSTFDTLENFDRLAATVDAVAPGCLHTRVVVGLHGLDTAEQRRIARTELAARSRGSVHVVNDAELLGPAAGYAQCIQLIVGTGAIAMGVDAHGTLLTADGYGAVLGDDGSAPALVRETVRAAMRHADLHGEAATLADPVVAALASAYRAASVADLALAVSTEDAYDWGRHAPLVFAAAARGSAVAQGVVESAAEALTRDVLAVRSRGALGTVVVAAGGVITHQTGLQQAFAERLARHDPELTVHVLTVPPVEGALVLAAAL